MEYVVAFKAEIYDCGEHFSERGFIYANSFAEATKKLEEYYGDPITELHMSIHEGPILVSPETFNTVLAELEGK